MSEMNGTALATTDEANYSPNQSALMNLVGRALMEDVPLEKLEKVLELQRRWEADQARKAYVQAMADFKSEVFEVKKDKTNKQYESRYTSIGNLVNTVTPFLAKHGLSADWEVEQGQGIKVTCIMTHRMGHSKAFSITVPQDTSGAKNPLQQIKSSITYGKIVTFESACGIASKEGNADDDGNGAGAIQPMAEDAVIYHLDQIREASTVDELKDRFFKANKTADEAKDKQAKGQFAKAKNTRYTQIVGGK